MVLIDGLGPKAIDSIISYFNNNNNLSTINKLTKLINIKNYQQLKSKSIFANKNLVFTGSMKTLSREEAKNLYGVLVNNDNSLDEDSTNKLRNKELGKV